ncbi:protein translocase subunit SecD [Corynebacterium sp. zg-331]|uniref:protein translocase subunit SecD n=1 Tax=unclassified Corynebacterium TaxID=2624378 RepID=UPI00128B7A9D|nr:MULTISPECIES: protein translocase subunit SecD [unclassified Corynebacterium]MBC3185448.1 protein translocase subunit SecD [Corynebacterium sp. zg-331]MPV51943.1 protein translocase subunit SecD [Corynebacterium sp. zg331]
MAGFLLLVLVVYALVFLTGDRHASPKLGIDLQGGTRVTLVPQGDQPTQEQLAQARTIMENRVNGMGVSGASVMTDGNTLVITVPGEDTSQARALGQTSKLLFRPVAQGGNPDLAAYPEVVRDMAHRWVEYGVLSREDATAAITKTVESINAARPEGQEEMKAPEVVATAKPEPANSIEATERRQELTEMLRKDRQSEDPTTQLAASTLLTCDGSIDPLQGTDDPAKPLVTCDPSAGEGTRAVILLDPAPVLVGPAGEDGTRLSGAQIDTDKQIFGGYDAQQGQMVINFAFATGGGSETWAKLTTEYEKKQVAITLDSQVISAPVIQSATPVGSGTSITGNFTQEEAQTLANNLRYGALPLSFAGENGESGGTTETIPASLGEASLKAGLIAGIVGMAAIAVFVFAYYRLYGLISLFTLVCSGVVIYGALVLLGRWVDYSLDLSGIAGLIIGLGATADSFVVIYERIKDEVREGHTFRSATRRGWDRAKRTVITGNMVTLIGSVVIYFLAVGEVKGFAFTLGMTTVFDLVVTFLVTAPLMQLAADRPFWSKPAVNGMGKVFVLAQARQAAATEGSKEER